MHAEPLQKCGLYVFAVGLCLCAVSNYKISMPVTEHVIINNK